MRYLKAILIKLNCINFATNFNMNINYINCTQQQGFNCGLCILKNTKMAINLQYDFENNLENRSFQLKLETIIKKKISHF